MGFHVKSFLLHYHLKAANTFSSLKTITMTILGNRVIKSQIEQLLFYIENSRISLQTVINYSIAGNAAVIGTRPQQVTLKSRVVFIR